VTERNRGVLRGRVHLVALAALTCALLGLAAVPAFALAAPIEVDSLGDAPQATPSATCDTGVPAEHCTLRAAIEAADFESDPSQVEFPEAMFSGGQQIEPATALPAITEPLTIFAHSHPYGAYSGPSVGVTAPTGAAGLRVQSDGVTVEDMAFGSGAAGIEVLAGSEGFVATGDWFGLEVTGVAAPIDSAGIVLEPGADLATIGAGEREVETRNVFTNSEAGIEVIGASKTKILGNYIGVEPDGTGPATLTSGIVVTDGPITKAEETEVGGVLSAAEAATPACDGACNAIATEGGFGIAIAGESAGLDHRSRIRGNLVGLAADGVTPVGERLDGVSVVSTSGCGGGPEVTVGGTAPTEANYIVGGDTGIYAEGAENFTAAGNAIGIGADGEPSTSPEGAGIAVCAEGVTGAAHVTGNRMVLGPGATGIESSWGRAQVIGNSIEGGTVGIVTNEESEGVGDLIQGNSISAVERQGIEIANDSNVVIGNTITRADWVGIDLESHRADHNRIGGDGPGEANTIVESGLRGNAEDGAITMFTRRELRNEFAANTGYGNHGAFIKLLTNPIEGEDANGIVPPAIATALQSSASGTTQPEATVRVYSKASAEPGELGVQLAVVSADAAGNWKATFAKQPVGGLLAATATKGGGTSEVSAPVAATADPHEEEKGGGNEGGGGGTGGGSTGTGSASGTSGPPPPPAVAKVAPKVKITGGPKKTATATTATFRFKVINVDRAKFECKLDSAKWASCKSPKAYKKLKPGKHTFRVRASAGGLTGPVTKYQFTVKS
jgi:Periplasmic copper-binding protein (NosD)